MHHDSSVSYTNDDKVNLNTSLSSGDLGCAG